VVYITYVMNNKQQNKRDETMIDVKDETKSLGNGTYNVMDADGNTIVVQITIGNDDGRRGWTVRSITDSFVCFVEFSLVTFATPTNVVAMAYTLHDAGDGTLELTNGTCVCGQQLQQWLKPGASVRCLDCRSESDRAVRGWAPENSVN